MELIGIKDFIDILIVGTLLYWVFSLLKRSGATQLFWGIFVIIAAWVIFSNVLQMELTGAIFNHIIDAGVVALIIIFQDELRGLMFRMGAQLNISKWLSRDKDDESANSLVAEELVRACEHLAKSKTGALIVLDSANGLKEYADSGEALHANVSARLIENIFFKNTPLHDGAMIINNHEIVAAACILPVSKSTSLPQQYGLRHRAALGINEKTTATAVVVSEETGHISVAVNETIREVTLEELLQETTRALRARA